MKYVIPGIVLLQLFKFDAIAQDPPTADFTCTVDTFSPPDFLCCIRFIDLSTDTPTAWAWDFGDGSNGYIQNPLHCYNYGPGVVSVTLDASNANGSDDTMKLLYIRIDSSGCYCPEDSIVVGTENIGNAVRGMSVFPNPFSDFTLVSITPPGLSGFDLKIYNTEGRLVRAVENLRGNKVILYRGSLPPGMYLIKVVSDNRALVQKSVIVTD